METSDSDYEQNRKRKPVRPRTAGLKSLPCFYRNCRYQYVRNGYVEKSDRYINVDQNLGHVRSCKKHKDKWLKMLHSENSKDKCDLCRGLNALDEEDVVIIHRGDFFLLCNYCNAFINN